MSDIQGYRIPSDYKNQTPRVNHNWRSDSKGTAHAGMIIPTYHRHLNAKERYRGKPQALIQSQPMLGPLLSGFKYITICTFTPDSVLYSWMRNGVQMDPQDYASARRWWFTPLVPNVSTVDASSYCFRPSAVEDVLPASGFVRRMYPMTPGLHSYTRWYADWTALAKSSSGTVTPLWPDHVGRGGLLDWLGVPAGSVAPRTTPAVSSADVTRGIPESWRFDASPFVAYFLSCYYYFYNVQEERMFMTMGAQDVINNLLNESNLAETGPASLYRFGFDPKEILQKIVQMGSVYSFSPADVSGNFAIATKADDPNLLGAWIATSAQANGGFFLAPYSPDLFGDVLKAGSMPSMNIPVIQDEEGQSAVSVPDVRLWTKIQNFRDRVSVSGGRMQDIYRTLFGNKARTDINQPQFLGIWQTSVNPINVVATAAGTDLQTSGIDAVSSQVGQLGARLDSWTGFKKHRGVDFTAKEPGTIMYLTVIVPDVTYTQGQHPDLAVHTFADLFNPELQAPGFETVPRHRYSMLPQSFSDQSSNPWYFAGTHAAVDPNLTVVAEQPAWSWLRTDYSRAHGLFAQEGVYDYWILTRHFTEYFNAFKFNGSTHTFIEEDFSTYVNPMSVQRLFTDQSYLSPNFTIVSAFDSVVTSAVGKNYMPFLGR